jgi:hypothetical protein
MTHHTNQQAMLRCTSAFHGTRHHSKHLFKAASNANGSPNRIIILWGTVFYACRLLAGERPGPFDHHASRDGCALKNAFVSSDNTLYEKVGKNEPVSIADEVPFEIPDSWEWIRLGTVCEVARGGSPRPIKDYLTDSDDGINWIKIGDSDKGGKYINSTKEKIIPEGMKKSRFVHAGDFLLTNSMSFGRPYCIQRWPTAGCAELNGRDAARVATIKLY